MKTRLRTVHNKLKRYGFDFRRFFIVINQKNRQQFRNDFEKLKKQKSTDNTFDWGSMYPIYHDKNDEGGTMKGHYFHQDLYVARLIHAANPEKHLDIGSRTDGFVAHVASFREIEIIDIREIKSKVKRVTFRQADLTQPPEDLLDYCDSISSLHAIEHFGLGRYGDPIDYFGHLKGIKNITKILKTGGTFYFSVPIGPQRIEFNAHRVFSISYLIDILSEDFLISSFSYVNDDGDFFEEVPLDEPNIASNFGCKFGCGIFTLTKK